jgi:hypothetical protein
MKSGMAEVTLGSTDCTPASETRRVKSMLSLDVHRPELQLTRLDSVCGYASHEPGGQVFDGK